MAAARCGELGAMAGGGVYTTIVSFGKTQADGSKAGSFGLQMSAEKWTQFPGVVYTGGPVINWKF